MMINHRDHSQNFNAGSIGFRAFFSPIIASFLCCSLFNWNELNFILASFFSMVANWFYLSIHFRENSFHIGVVNCSSFLSIVFSIGLFLIFYQFESVFLLSLGFYFVVLAVFHFGEFEATAILNSHVVSIDSFLLNQSLEYHLALLISLIEYTIESYYFYEWKFFKNLDYAVLTIGLIVCLIGDFFRKLAMFTAGRNFNHIIQTDFDSNHKLITIGIYSIVRHPSYVGWFYWSLGTQIILHNPFSLIGYAIVSWRFFKQRIDFEEKTLINFFGDKYLEYKKNVPTGLPWINGF